MNENIEISEVVIKIIVYALIIAIAQWICGKIFYDVDAIPQLIYAGKWIKGGILLIILFFIYLMASAALADDKNGKVAAILITIFLLWSIVGDLNDVYKDDNGLYNVPLFLGVVLFNGMDVLKIIAMYVAFKD